MDKNPDPGPLGTRLAELRSEAGISLYELEKRSGVNRPKLLRIESGAIRQPTVETLNRLAAALDVDPEELYDAAWAESADPLPSLPTYFRSKYQLSDQQIAAVEKAVKRIADKPSPTPPTKNKKITNERRKT